MLSDQFSVGSIGVGSCARRACCLAQRRWVCQSSCGMCVMPCALSGGPNGMGCSAMLPSSVRWRGCWEGME